MAAVLRAIDLSVGNSLRQAVDLKPLAENAPLAQSIGTTLPIVQGPMTRVSDNVQFAVAVSQGGALPTLALSLMKGQSLNQLLEETAKALDGAPWGIGLLGFAPQSLFDEQLAAVKKYRPDFAVIAGGRPDQALKLEESFINTYLHVPSANLIPLFLQEGARRFIFEGRECGGHVGPLSSFVLWSTMVDRLLSELEAGEIAGEDIYVLFAGGIHDAVSSAIVQVLAAPLAFKGVKIGILMGSSYIFTREIVNSGAIVPTFQTKAVDCEHTVCLQSGPGHASRCAYTPFAKTFFHQRIELREKKVPAGEMREALDKFILGRLRLATRGCARTGSDNELQEFDESYQQQEGMYMLGQVATLRKEVTDIPALHREVTEIAHQLLVKRLDETLQVNESFDEKPVDVAIVGIAAVLPKANTQQDYWENILNKVNAITEIPPHRWDWHLYYDENRQAKDKIYSKWGGFIDDMAFDPTRYGIPPKSIESVDPMQLMALEVARRTLIDAGYEKREFDRLRTSIIIGASGGVGDVGMQYGLRSEFPRFQGNLPESVAGRLPEWTEDTFAGILPNVVAGRIANRLNFGGVNFTTDAACASSLAAIYQGVSELAAGRSNFVISGGVDTVQGPFGYMCFSKTQALSPRGRCETFETSADGIVISEGIAMIAMKRLKDAERDGDRIYAVIKGVGGSSDGRARGLTAPEPAGQLLA
ncbi:MAG: beta-ketoacyl synthase N-terminal-like domain-containing protein, partial [Desulfobacterales bacterium]